MAARVLLAAALLVISAVRLYYMCRSRRQPTIAVAASSPAWWLVNIITVGWWAFVSLFILAPGVVCWACWTLPPGARAITFAVGSGLLVVGVCLFAWSHYALDVFWSGRSALKLAHQIVQDGPYRLVRHPMYSSFLLWYAGTLFIIPHPWPLLVLICAAVGHWKLAQEEERMLIALFGRQYQEYQRRTGAFWPVPWPK